MRLEKPEQERGRRQERQGKVVSDAMEKTIVVEVSVVKAHPKYKKVVRRSVKFQPLTPSWSGVRVLALSVESSTVTE